MTIVAMTSLLTILGHLTGDMKIKNVRTFLVLTTELFHTNGGFGGSLATNVTDKVDNRPGKQ